MELIVLYIFIFMYSGFLYFFNRSDKGLMHGQPLVFLSQ